MRFSDRVAVITGGASGIGAATAVLLASEGAKVAVVDVARDRLTDVERRIAAANGNGLAIEGDVLEPDRVTSMAEEVITVSDGSTSW